MESNLVSFENVNIANVMNEVVHEENLLIIQERLEAENEKEIEN